MREHQRHDRVRFHDATTLREYPRHAPLVVVRRERPRALLALELRGVGDRLVLLVREAAREQLRVDVARGALEPDVEEVAQLRVHDVVVVGRVHDDDIDAGVSHVDERVRRLAQHRDVGSRVRAGCQTQLLLPSQA